MGHDLRYQTRPGVSIAPYRERISQNKPALITALLLRAEILKAAAKGDSDFDPEHYITLWRRYDALGGRLPLCRACPQPELCLTADPRAPGAADTACPAFPIEAVIPESPESRPPDAVRPQEVESRRREGAAADMGENT
jgi:hypothetical protein